MRYLIAGFGNIGKKRKNILGKKCLATYDPINPQADYQLLTKIPNNTYDTAVLTVPQKNKFDLAQHFLSLGKNVLVEKPLIIDKTEHTILSNLMKKNKTILQTSYNHRFEPNIIKLKKYLAEGFIGKLYHSRFVYSFGNIQERIGTWREQEYSVLEEIAPHLLDIILTSLNYKSKDFQTISAKKLESKIFDHWLFSTTDQKVFIETSSVTWKNVFLIEIYGSLGSLHLEGLQKWGQSKLTIRKRVLPSGIPTEKVFLKSGPDLTWKEDFKYFESQVKTNKSSLDYDLEISKTLANIVLSAPNSKDPARKKYQQILK